MTLDSGRAVSGRSVIVSQSLRLRSAEPDDYDDIAGVVDDWWGRPVRSSLPRLFLDHFHRTSLVAEDADGLAGFLIGLLSPSMPDAAYNGPTVDRMVFQLQLSSR